MLRDNDQILLHSCINSSIKLMVYCSPVMICTIFIIFLQYGSQWGFFSDFTRIDRALPLWTTEQGDGFDSGLTP